MHSHNTEIDGLHLIDLEPHGDDRGWFMRSYCREELSNAVQQPLAQINHSFTKNPATIRGLHYQAPPYAETKLVRCLRGSVYDVAVDIRANSRTFLKWYGVELTSQNNRMLVIPEGFAHGFQTLEPNCELLYLHTQYYHPEAEASIAWNDPILNIAWPEKQPQLSQKDSKVPFLTRSFRGVSL